MTEINGSTPPPKYPVPEYAIFVIESAVMGEPLMGIEIRTPVTETRLIIGNLKTAVEFRETLNRQMQIALREMRELGSGLKVVRDLPAGLKRK